MVTVTVTVTVMVLVMAMDLSQESELGLQIHSLTVGPTMFERIRFWSMGTFSGFFPAMGWMSGSPSWQAWQVNQLDTEHQTALMWAAALGHSSVVQGLIGRDAKAGQRGVQGWAAWRHAEKRVETTSCRLDLHYVLDASCTSNLCNYLRG